MKVKNILYSKTLSYLTLNWVVHKITTAHWRVKGFYYPRDSQLLEVLWTGQVLTYMHAYLHTIFMQITHHTRTLMYDTVLNKNIKTRCLKWDVSFSQQWLWQNTVFWDVTPCHFPHLIFINFHFGKHIFLFNNKNNVYLNTN